MHTDTRAVLGLPVSLIVALLISAVVLGAITLSLYTRWKDTEIYVVTQEVNKIVVEAESMFEYANDGSFKRIPVSFPDSLRCIVFGSFPVNTTDISQNQTLNEQTSNNYYVVMSDGTTIAYHSTVRFSDVTFQRIVVLYPGTYDIALELQTYEGKTYVTISVQ